MENSGGRPRVVHVTADFPDVIDSAKTRVIETLVQLVDKRFDQRVISLNRVEPSLAALFGVALGRRSIRVEATAQGSVTAVRYLAPGRGLYHATMLKLLADWLVARLRRDGLPDLLVGHKLTVEGLIVARAARRLGIPYAISVQGNTDRRILAARRDLWPQFRRIYHEAAVVFPFAPWAHRFVEARLGARQGKTVLLPCPTASDVLIPPAPSENGEVVSAFHLHNYRGKNAPALIAAAGIVAANSPGFRLAIVGGGAAADIARVKALTARVPAVTLEGGLPLAAMPARMHRAAGFALPSRSDTFGLVFIESLFAGTPILYPAGTAVDGYFDDAPFAVRVNARDRHAIAGGLERLVRDESQLKAALARWQTSAAAEHFRRPGIARAFGDGLLGAV